VQKCQTLLELYKNFKDKTKYEKYEKMFNIYIFILVGFKQKLFHNFRNIFNFFPINDDNFHDRKGTLRVANMNRVI
jgi:hypothetical protein